MFKKEKFHVIARLKGSTSIAVNICFTFCQRKTISEYSYAWKQNLKWVPFLIHREKVSNTYVRMNLKGVFK